MFDRVEEIVVFGWIIREVVLVVEEIAYTSSVCKFFFSSRRRHTRLQGDWSSDVCSSDLTFALALISIFLSYLIAIPLGIYSATHQNTTPDKISTVTIFILYSLPSFWIEIGRASCRERV